MASLRHTAQRLYSESPALIFTPDSLICASSIGAIDAILTFTPAHLSKLRATVFLRFLLPLTLRFAALCWQLFAAFARPSCFVSAAKSCRPSKIVGGPCRIKVVVLTGISSPRIYRQSGRSSGLLRCPIARRLRPSELPDIDDSRPR